MSDPITTPLDWFAEDWGGHVRAAAYVDAEAGCDQ